MSKILYNNYNLCGDCDAINRAYNAGIVDAIEKFRRYLKTVVPCEMPQEIWNMGVDNTCDRMLKEQRNE